MPRNWRFVTALALCVFISLTDSQPIMDCKDAPLYQKNTRIAHSLFEDLVDRRCYRFSFATPRDVVDLRVEPCQGPMPAVYVSLSSDLSPGNSSGTATGYSKEKRAVSLELTNVVGTFYVMVTLPSVTADTPVPVYTEEKARQVAFSTANYVIYLDDFTTLKPALGLTTLSESKLDDRSVRVEWETANDPGGLAVLEYAVFVFPEKPAYLLSAYARTAVDTSREYFGDTICSLEADAMLHRAFSPLTVSLRGESYIVSPNNLTLHYDIDNLNNGYRYRINVVARNPAGFMSMYETLYVDTWQIGPTGITAIIVMVITWLVCVITYVCLRRDSRRKRKGMFVSASNLPRDVRHFAAADIEGYFYLLPKRVVAEVGADEELMWAGRPDYSKYTGTWYGLYLALTVSTFFILFLVGWFFRDVWNASILAPYMVVFLSFSVVFFVAIPRPCHTVYALTNRRAIIYERIFWVWPRTISYLYEEMHAGHLQTRMNPDQSGCVFFDLKHSILYCRHEPIGFWFVKNANRALLHISHFREEIYKEFFLHNEAFAIRGNSND